MSHASKPDFTGKTAVVVDDDFDFLSQIELYLKQFGFTVKTAESQAAGEELIKETDYDLAVFDLMMENHDSGFILGFKSKQLKPSAPVILITAVTTETGLQFDAITEESRDWIKADAVLNKGIRCEQLEREVERLMEG